MGKVKRLWVGGILIFIGLGIYFYPDVRNWKIREEVNQMKENIEDHRSRFEKDKVISQNNKETEDDVLYWEMKKYNEHLVSDGQKLVDAWSYEKTPAELKTFGNMNQVIGYIEIPDMKVQLPLLVGASEENLAKGAGILSETSMPIGGKDTNCVVAGHRGWKGSPYFQYIENMDYGSMVYIHTLWEKRAYKAVDFKIVDSFDVESVLIQKGKDMITLMSCHPYGVTGSKNRYLVYCEYVELQDRQETKTEKNEEVHFISDQKKDQKQETKNWIMWEDRIRFLFLCIISVYFMFRLKK